MVRPPELGMNAATTECRSIALLSPTLATQLPKRCTRHLIRVQSPNMAKQPMTKVALKRALASIHPDPEIARELLAMGVYRIRRDGRLNNGKCGARARTTGEP